MDATQADALRKPFPASAIGKLPKGGTQLDYVGHAAVTDRLLAVDPEWSWEPFAVNDRGLPALDGSNNLWIRLTVCGVTRIGVGDGKSAKEVIGDAIRNAAMRFGVALDLWGKEELEQSGGPAHAITPQDAPTPPPTAPSRTMSRTSAPADDGLITARQTGALHAAFNEAGMSDRDVRLNYCRKLIGRDIESSKDLTRAEASKVLDALKADAAEPALIEEPA
jgi:hypothetical protein